MNIATKITIFVRDDIWFNKTYYHHVVKTQICVIAREVDEEEVDGEIET
jgi:hypothetical protein